MELVLLGRPVSHSLSPAFQGAALRAEGIAGRYVAQEVDEAGLAAAIGAMRRGEIDGGNVTLPWKAQAAALADGLAGVAGTLGVVNTLVRDGGRVIGFNTDVEGVRGSQAAVTGGGVETVVVVGAGGAALAALCGVEASRRVVVQRSGPGAQRLRDRLDALGAGGAAWARRTRVLDGGSEGASATFSAAFAEAGLIVQASSAGHGGDGSFVAGLPWGVVRPDVPVLELSYGVAAAGTRSLCAAFGLRFHDGLGMLLLQGAASFRLWTGREAPIGVMRSALATAAGVSPEAIAAPAAPRPPQGASG